MQEDKSTNTEPHHDVERRKNPRIDRRQERLILGVVVLLVVLGFVIVGMTSR
jgi:hypothetical protein